MLFKFLYMKSIYTIIIVSIVLSACKFNRQHLINENINNNQIDSILVTYLCGDFDSSVAIKCEKLAAIQAEHFTNDYSRLSLGIMEQIDTFIVDNEILKRIQPLLTKNIESSNQDIDARMYVTIKYKNNSFDNICLGMEAPQVSFNGLSVLIDNELLYLLREHSGYYKWFEESKLLDFTEINAINKSIVGKWCSTKHSIKYPYLEFCPDSIVFIDPRIDLFTYIPTLLRTIS